MPRGLVLLAVLIAGCNVPAEPGPSPTVGDQVMLGNLRRAGEALDEAIRREREHVDALSKQLDAVRVEEDRAYAAFLEAESAYRLTQADAEGVEADLELAREELAAAQQALADLRREVEQVLAEIAALREELARLQDARDGLRADVSAAGGDG